MWIAVGLMLVLSVASASALGADYVVLGTVPIVPKGVTLLGHDLGGMNDAQVRAAIEDNVSTPAMQPLTVQGDGKSWTLDPKGIVTVDVEGMVSQAYAPGRNAVLVSRLSSWAGGQPLTGVVKPAYTVDSATLSAWIRDTATTVDRAPVDATRTVAGHAIQVTPEVLGASVDQTKAVDSLAQALTDEAGLESASRVASLPITVIEPKVLQTKFKTAIVVSLAKCTVYLYDGATLVKSYRCAPGRAAFPTPKGDFVIDKKLANSPWYNPHSDWSANMPDVIPAGPSNPMGVRKIGINYPGVFLHGIPRSEYSSIGTHASHGCMRMLPSDVLDLYGRVRIGDPVYIRN